MTYTHKYIYIYTLYRYIDFDEFKFIWIKLANLKEELISRGVEVSQWSNPWSLMRKLELLLEKEEESERLALAESRRWAKWQKDLEEKKKLIAKAKQRADEELQIALDTAGQVYVFGLGTSGQFLGTALKGEFNGFLKVKKLWKERVAPKGEIVDSWLLDPFIPPTTKDLADVNNNYAIVDKVVLNLSDANLSSKNISLRAQSRTRQKAKGYEERKDGDNPFKQLICMVNTVALWGRRIVQVGVGENTAFAVSAEGRIYAW